MTQDLWKIGLYKCVKEHKYFKYFRQNRIILLLSIKYSIKQISPHIYYIKTLSIGTVSEESENETILFNLVNH